MVERASAADRLQKARVEAFQNERPIDHQERQRTDRGNAADEVESSVVHGQDGAEQDVEQIDIAAVSRYQQYAQGQRGEIETGEARVLAQYSAPADDTGEQRNGKTGRAPPGGHTPKGQTGHHETHRRTGQNRMRHGIAHEAHPTQK